MFAAKTRAHILKEDVGGGSTAKASHWWDETRGNEERRKPKSASALVPEELAKISKA